MNNLRVCLMQKQSAALPGPRGGTAISSKYRANPSPAGTMEHWAARIPAAQRDLARR
jgi:hypothetical protein